MDPKELEKLEQKVINDYIRTAAERKKYAEEHSEELQPIRLINYCCGCPARRQ